MYRHPVAARPYRTEVGIPTVPSLSPSPTDAPLRYAHACRPNCHLRRVWRLGRARARTTGGAVRPAGSGASGTVQRGAGWPRTGWLAGPGAGSRWPAWGGAAGLGFRTTGFRTLRQGVAPREVAPVLGVYRGRARRLQVRARTRLEASLGVLRTGRSGRVDCGQLGALLAGWDGRLTSGLRARVGRHVDRCATCTATRASELRPARLLGPPPATAPAAGTAESLRLALGARARPAGPDPGARGGRRRGRGGRPAGRRGPHRGLRRGRLFPGPPNPPPPGWSRRTERRRCRRRCAPPGRPGSPCSRSSRSPSPSPARPPRPRSPPSASARATASVAAGQPARPWFPVSVSGVLPRTPSATTAGQPSRPARALGGRPASTHPCQASLASPHGARLATCTSRPWPLPLSGRPAGAPLTQTHQPLRSWIGTHRLR